MPLLERDRAAPPAQERRRRRAGARVLVAGLGSVLAATAHGSLEPPWTPRATTAPALPPRAFEPMVLPSAASSSTVVSPGAPALLFPVPEGRRTGLETHFTSRRGHVLHHAVDIAAPRRTKVHAAAEGRIVRLHRSRKGGIGIEQVDDAGQYCFYYAHLQAYAPGLKAGQQVTRDQILGFVGSTGAARGPHLHFQVMKLLPGQDCWAGAPLDPLPLFEPPAQAADRRAAPHAAAGQ
jgi:murein DD-endopeptidase MepM/ murein hydrolase activator NlpD